MTWTPLRSGTYALQVWVRAAGSTASYDAWLGSGDVTVTGVAPTVVSLTADQGFPLAPGSPVTWTAKAAADATPLEYKFWWYRQATGVWTMARDYTPDPTWTWTPPANDSYRVQAWVRAPGSGNGYDAWLGTEPFAVTSGPVSSVSLTSNQTTPLATALPITWTAQATGGTAPLLYQFWLYDRETTSWTVVQAWSANNQFTWTPTRSEFGIHALQVWVKSTGATDWEAWAGTGWLVILP